MNVSIHSIAAAVATIAMCGCTTVSNWVKPGPDVIKTATDTYKVNPGAGGGSPTDAEIKSRGIKIASDYCDAQGKHALVIVAGSSGWHMFSTQTPEVSFVCDELPPVRPVGKAVS